MATSCPRQVHSETQEEVERQSGQESENRRGEGALALTNEEEEEETDHDKHLHEASSIEQLQAGNSLQHVHLKAESSRQASLLKDFQSFTFSALASAPTLADIPAIPKAYGSVPMYPSKEVEGALQTCLTSAEIQVKRLLQQAMDSVQSHVLRALHQAATNISENLGKEASHRVVIAERKADLFELELSNVKQQALSMLLRLKADTDSQALELDKKYIVEKRRAQEAEAKLAIANDNLKRLKSELKRKGDILNQMQKPVQPETEDKFSEGTELVQDSSKSVSNDMYRKSPQSRNLRAVEYTSFFVCNRMPYQGTQALTRQLHNPALQVSADLDKKINTSEETPAATKGFLYLERQTSSSSETFQDDHFSPSLHKEDPPAEKSKMEERDSLGQDMTVVDLPGPYAVIDHRQTEQTHPSNIEVLHGKVVPEILSNQRIIEDEDSGVFKGANATIRGFYVRRKVREHGKPLEKKGPNLSMGKPNLSHVDHLQSNLDAFGMLSREAASELGTPDLERCPESEINVTNSDCLLAYEQCRGEPLPLNLDEIRMDNTLDERNIVCATNDLSISCSKDQDFIEAMEFARPDYEVASSLAELAAVGLNVRTQPQEDAPLPVIRKGDHFLRPGKTGLRMKRKGMCFDKRAVLDVGSNATKKVRRNSKVAIGSKNGHRGMVSRRTRGNSYTSSKACLSLESSRDSRRLMQGARQLLCLAERKWR